MKPYDGLYDELVYLSEHSDGLRGHAAIKYLSDYLKKFAANSGEKKCKLRRLKFREDLELLPPAGVVGDFLMKTDDGYGFPVYAEDLKKLVERSGLGLTEEESLYVIIYTVSWEEKKEE